MSSTFTIYTGLPVRLVLVSVLHLLAVYNTHLVNSEIKSAARLKVGHKNRIAYAILMGILGCDYLEQCDSSNSEQTRAKVRRRVRRTTSDSEDRTNTMNTKVPEFFFLRRDTNEPPPLPTERRRTNERHHRPFCRHNIVNIYLVFRLFCIT